MKITISTILVLLAWNIYSQDQPFTLSEAIEQALNNNARIQAAGFNLAAQRKLRSTSFDLPKTDVSVTYGQYNSYVRNDNNVTISQTIPFRAFGHQAALNKALAVAGEMEKAVAENEIVYQVKQVYLKLAFARSRHRLLQRQDSIYEGFLRSASSRYSSGETRLLEKSTAEAQRNAMRNELMRSEAGILQYRTKLKALLNVKGLPDITVSELTPMSLEEVLDTIAYQSNPSLAYQRQQIEVASREKNLEAAKAAPDLSIGFFSQTLIGEPEFENGSIATRVDRFSGFKIGISLPVWFVPHRARTRAADLRRQAAETDFDFVRSTLQGEVQAAIQQLTTQRRSLDHYIKLALPNADLILAQSQVAFREGEIGYAEYLIGTRDALRIQEAYLATLNDYNQNIIYLEYLTGKYTSL